jgi:hypothetical protein
MSRKIIAVGVTLSALVLAALPAAASAGSAAPARAHPADNATQTLGSATLYGTSTPLSPGAASANSSRTRAHPGAAPS